MPYFIRSKTRLNCDLFEAYRALTQEKRIEKWLDGKIVASGDNWDFRGDIFDTAAMDNPVLPVIWKGKIVFKNQDFEIGVRLSFFRMKCTSLTEYCTEIQMCIALENAESTLDTSNGAYISSENEKYISEFGEFILEKLRVNYNKSWIILDSDLSASSLK